MRSFGQQCKSAKNSIRLRLLRSNGGREKRIKKVVENITVILRKLTSLCAQAVVELSGHHCTRRTKKTCCYAKCIIIVNELRTSCECMQALQPTFSPSSEVHMRYELQSFLEKAQIRVDFIMWLRSRMQRETCGPVEVSTFYVF